MRVISPQSCLEYSLFLFTLDLVIPENMFPLICVIHPKQVPKSTIIVLYWHSLKCTLAWGICHDSVTLTILSYHMHITVFIPRHIITIKRCGSHLQIMCGSYLFYCVTLLNYERYSLVLFFYEGWCSYSKIKRRKI